MAFVREVAPRFNQLDPAGILFFGEAFTLCSGVYEDFVLSLGFTWDEWFDNPAHASPIVHAEADYSKPIRGGQVYEVHIEVASMSTSAFEIGYTVERLGSVHCRVRIVHVFIDKKTGVKTAIPALVREAFSRFGSRSASEAPSLTAFPKASVGSPQASADAGHAQKAAPTD